MTLIELNDEMTGGEAKVDTSCGGHGQWRESYCRCNQGYTWTEDRKSCMPIAQSPEVEPWSPEGFSFMPMDLMGTSSELDGGAQLWRVTGSDDDAGATLLIEIRQPPETSITPGVVAFDDAQTSYETCSVCVVLRTDCEFIGNEWLCRHTFMPQAQGELSLDAIEASVGSRLAGELSDLMFQEVNIGSGFVTTPLTGGFTVPLERLAFDVTIEEPNTDEPQQDEPCNGNGVLHSDHCECFPGYRSPPGDLLSCLPE